MASNVLDTPESPRPTVSEELHDERRWGDIFPETAPAKGLRLVMIRAPWSAHSLEAFTNLQEARDHFATRGVQVEPSPPRIPAVARATSRASSRTFA